MKTKRIISFVLATTISVTIFVLICLVISNIKSHNLLIKAEKLYKDANINIIYIGRDTCSFCQKFNPVIEEVTTKYNLDYTYINTDKLTTNDLIALLDTFHIDAKTFGTPLLLITQNNQIINKQDGFTDELNLFILMQNTGLIDKNIENPYIVSDTNPEIKKFNDLFLSEEKQLIYFGRPDCHYCQLLDPILKEIVETNKIDYNYININEISSLELSTMLYKLGKKRSEFGTPYLVVTQNGNMLGEQNGYAEKEELLAFIKKYLLN